MNRGVTMKISFIISIFCFFHVLSLRAETLSLADVLNSSKENFPEIKMAIIEIEMQKLKQVEALGEFDTKLSAYSDNRLEGYYDGDFIDVMIEKPMSWSSSKVYAGYRRSNGEIPVYEGKKETLADGESFVGVSLALLRDQKIDIRRFKNKLAKIQTDRSQIKYVQSVLNVRRAATIAYYNWAFAGHVQDVYKELYQISLEREKALKEKFRRGDIAKIYLTENEQYLVARESKLLQSKQYFENAAENLSIFYRNKEGAPIIVGDDKLPPIGKVSDEISLINKDFHRETVKLIKETHPALKELDNELGEYQLKEKYYKNQMLPELDFKLEHNNNYGTGPKSLEGDEVRAMIQFNMPLENRKARSKYEVAKIYQNSLKIKRSYKSNQFEVKLNNLFRKLKLNSTVIKNTDLERKLAMKLREAEQERFSKGDSNFLIVNIREQNYATAKIKNIQSMLNYFTAKAKYDEISLISIAGIDRQ